MPIYVWIDTNKENRAEREDGRLSDPLKVEVLRSFDDYQIEPKEEAGEIPEEEWGKERKWERIIDTAPKVSRAPGFGRKGHW